MFAHSDGAEFASATRNCASLHACSGLSQQAQEDSRPFRAGNLFACAAGQLLSLSQPHLHLQDNDTQYGPYEQAQQSHWSNIQAALFYTSKLKMSNLTLMKKTAIPDEQKT